MEMQIDINQVIDKYKNRIAELEHQVIMYEIQIEELTKLIDKKELTKEEE